MLFCPKCNGELREEMNFCPNCGFRFKNVDTEIQPIVISGGILRFGKNKSLPIGPWLATCVWKDESARNNVDPKYSRSEDGRIEKVLNPECLAVCIGTSIQATHSYYENMTRYTKKHLKIGDTLLIEGGSDDSIIIMDGVKFIFTRPPQEWFEK